MDRQHWDCINPSVFSISDELFEHRAFAAACVAHGPAEQMACYCERQWEAVVWPKREAVNGLRVQRKKTLAAHQMKSRTFWADADMFPLERVMGRPEAIMSDQTGIGVSLELKCPHCGGHLKLISEDQPWMYVSRLKRKLGHVLVVTVIYESGRSLLYLATTREPETKI